jgi:hypothetical protein
MNTDSLKIVYEHIPPDERLYNSYEEFLKDIHDFKKDKVNKQLLIIKERIECAQKLLNKYIEDVEKEIDNSTRRKIDT